MLKKLLIYLSLCIALTPTYGLENTQNIGYFWPLATEKALTSTFGEYRVGHFHAGLDLKTWGEPGYEVYAIEDGYVWQVKTSSYGYGKVVYLKLNDGKIIVYGHLQDFCDKIQQKVFAQQKKMGRYRISLTFGKNDLPVKKGELIGYSGGTGAGAPHLHFEMRDNQNHPINPLNYGFTVDDSVPPIINQLSIVPLGHFSTINGNHSIKILDCTQNEKGYFLGEIPQISGKFYVGISAKDHTEKAPNPLGIYKAKLFLNNQSVYGYQFDQFSYDDTHEIDLLLDFSLYWNGHGKFYRLFRPKGTTSQVFGHQKIETGILNTANLSTGYHDLRIEVSDFYENKSTLNFRILVDSPPKIELTHKTNNDRVILEVKSDRKNFSNITFEKSENNGISWRSFFSPNQQETNGIPRTEWKIHDDTIRLFRAISRDSLGVESISNIIVIAPQKDTADTVPPNFELALTEFPDFWQLKFESSEFLSQMPQITVTQKGGSPVSADINQQSPTSFSAIYPLVPNQDGIAIIEISGADLAGNMGKTVASMRIGTISASPSDSFTSSDGNASIHVPGGAVQENMFVRIEEEKVPETNEFQQGLKGISGCYTILPEDIPFMKKATVSLKYPDKTENLHQLGVYQWLNNGKWKLKGDILDVSKKTISARVKYFGIYKIFADTLAPEIYHFSPREATVYRNNTPTIFAKTRDVGSGIYEDDIILKLDDKIVIAEYDYEKETIEAEIGEQLSAGEHVFSLTVTDKAGNTTTEMRTIKVIQ